MNETEKQKTRDRVRAYYLRHRDMILAKHKKYYLDNLERCRKYGREYSRNYSKIRSKNKADNKKSHSSKEDNRNRVESSKQVEQKRKFRSIISEAMTDY